jgi:tetratricopeptide (TPR) repeat protein
MSKEESFDPDAGLTPQELEREKKIEEEERAKNPELWKKNMEWLNYVNGVLEKITDEDAERAVEMMGRFIEGEVTWAEVEGMPKKLLHEMAQFGYLQLKRGKLKEAEKVFKGLSFLDHKNAYYHTALGSIYQRMDKLGDALAEYTAAIEMDPGNIAALVNRGEIYYRCGYVQEPLEDFEKAISLDPKGKDRWSNRARFLKNLVYQEGKVLSKNELEKLDKGS